MKISDNERIYLDWNATGLLLPSVRSALIEALETTVGNASSIHREGQMARTKVERARRAVSRAIGAAMQSVVLTGGATEGNNQVLLAHVRNTPEAFVVCSAVEHPSVLEVVDAIAGNGVRTAVWPVDHRGRLDLDWLAEQLKAGATLVSVMWANNETGNIHPIEEIGRMVRKAGAIFHVDATQALGRIPVRFDSAIMDYMTLSFHKMGGPKGIGAILVREGLKIEAIMYGGHQERGRRPGTENIMAAAGLEAAALALEQQGDAWQQTLVQLRSVFKEALREHVGEIEFRGDADAQLPNTLNLAFEGVDGEDLLLALDLEGIAASSGSACTAGSLEPSHVILAMGFEPARARQSVRFSFGPSTREAELREAAQRIGQVVKRLRNL